MKDKDGFEPILTATIKGSGNMNISFLVPKELEPFVLSNDHIKCAVEYYLLARYAFFHRMHFSFSINTFWAVEHLILSIFSLNKMGMKELESIGFHSIFKYWNKAKNIIPNDASPVMNDFDSYIAKVQGYLVERYPYNTPCKGKLTYSTERSPRVNSGDDKSKKAQSFGKVVPISLDELDHFVNFMLHDITKYGEDPGNFMEFLASQDNMALYMQDNKYSIVHPNRVYNGEKK